MMKRYVLFRIVMLVALSLVTAALEADVSPEKSTLASAKSPSISSQGLLRDSSGKPITATGDITFALYNDHAERIPLSTDTHPVNINNGLTTTISFDTAGGSMGEPSGLGLPSIRRNGTHPGAMRGAGGECQRKNGNTDNSGPQSQWHGTGSSSDRGCEPEYHHLQ